jgi:hypothetical protein
VSRRDSGQHPRQTEGFEVVVILIASAFVAFVAVPVLVAIRPRRKPTDKTSPRPAGQTSNHSEDTHERRG